MCTCPHCGNKCDKEDHEFLPVVCPYCHADLYTEEVEFQEMLTNDVVEVA
jgi:hypothetical protein